MELEAARATQNSFGSSLGHLKPVGAGGGQRAFNHNVVSVLLGQQYNAFGVPINDGTAAGSATAHPEGHVQIRENHEEHMSRSEMAVVGAFFDKIMKPGKQRKTWGYIDSANGDGDVDDDNSDEDGNGGNGGDESGHGTSRATHQGKGPRHQEPAARTTHLSATDQHQDPVPTTTLPTAPSVQLRIRPSNAGQTQNHPSSAPGTNLSAPLAQQVGLPAAFYTNAYIQPPILPSALPTRHVSPSGTNIQRRGSGGTTCHRTVSKFVGPGSTAFDSGRCSFSQQQKLRGVQVPMSYGPLALTS